MTHAPLDQGEYPYHRKLDWLYVVSMTICLLASVLVDGAHVPIGLDLGADRTATGSILKPGFLPLPLSLLSVVSGQIFYPSRMIPNILKKAKQDYLDQSRDPVVGRFGASKFAWFWMAVVLGLLWQCPIFLIGIWRLLRGKQRCDSTLRFSRTC